MTVALPGLLLCYFSFNFTIKTRPPINVNNWQISSFHALNGFPFTLFKQSLPDYNLESVCPLISVAPAMHSGM